MIDLYDANDIEAAGITKLKIRSLSLIHISAEQGDRRGEGSGDLHG